MAIVLVLTITLGSISSVSVTADWINLTGAETAPNIAEITVLDDRVNVRLEIYIGDLEVFADVIPDQLLKNGGEGRPAQSERLRHFSGEVLTIQGPDGTPLQAILKLTEPRTRIDRKSPFAGMINPQTRRRVPDAPADKRVLYVELDYPFDGQPTSLTISPPRDDAGNTAVTMGFIVYHKAVPVIDFRYLSQKAKLDLDWDDPWYSRFQNPNLNRHHKNALMSFLYVEPREVRHELLFRVRDLEGWADLGIPHAEIIAAQHQAILKERTLAFLESRNPLTIDGKGFRPRSSRAEFINISLTGVQAVEEGEPVDPATAILGVILSYPVERLPQEISIKWDLFNERIDRVPVTSIDPAGPYPNFVEADDPDFKWQNYLREYVEPEIVPVLVDARQSIQIPLVSAVLFVLGLVAAGAALRNTSQRRRALIGACLVTWAGAAVLSHQAIIEVRNPFQRMPDGPISEKIVTDILANVHTAYLEREETRLDGALAVAIAEEALADIKPELSRSLAVKVAGGGIARITEIQDLSLQEITALDHGFGFRSIAEWTALATAGHWGHVHRQRLRFRALMEIAQKDGTWKLIGLTIVETRTNV